MGKFGILEVIFLVFLTKIVAETIVETKFGKVDGFEYQTLNGKIAEIFLGLPFAEAPVDDLRFEKPREVKPWQNTLNATKFPAPCAVMDPLFAMNSNEDCLYLNIFRPKQKSKSAKGHPILVYVHGGSFIIGSTEAYGFRTISDNFIPHDVIIVTIQYRLGPWGFFSSGDSRMPGNLGLWDQIQALKFLQEIANDFGGDPSRITLFGHSAGAAAVSWLSLSPQSTGLFQQIIQFSGSSFANWARSDDVVDFSRNLATKLGCQTNSTNLKECLKKFTMNEIQNHVSGLGLFRQNINFAFFNPRFDGELIQSKNIEEAIVKSEKRPTWIGVTSQDSLLWSIEQIGLIPPGKFYNLPEDQVAVYSRNDLANFIKKNLATRKKFGLKASEAADDIISQYADTDSPSTPDNLFYFQRFTQLLSDLHFNIPAIREARRKTISKHPTFFQIYSFEKPMEITEYPIHGTPHGSEMDPLFKNSAYSIMETTEDDEKIQKILVNQMANFIKTGVPSTKKLTAPMMTKSSFQFIDMDLTPKILKNPFQKNFAFWEKMAKKYGFDVSRGINLRSPLKVRKTRLSNQEVPFKQAIRVFN